MGSGGYCLVNIFWQISSEICCEVYCPPFSAFASSSEFKRVIANQTISSSNSSGLLNSSVFGTVLLLPCASSILSSSRRPPRFSVRGCRIRSMKNELIMIYVIVGETKKKYENKK